MTTHPPLGGKESISLLFYVSPYLISLYIIIPYISSKSRVKLEKIFISLYIVGTYGPLF